MNLSLCMFWNNAWSEIAQPETNLNNLSRKSRFGVVHWTFKDLVCFGKPNDPFYMYPFTGNLPVLHNTVARHAIFLGKESGYVDDNITGDKEILNIESFVCHYAVTRFAHFT